MIILPVTRGARQKPSSGARLSTPIAGGFWACSEMHGGVSDAAGGSPPAKVIGGVTRVQGPFGGPALKFDNATGYVDCGLMATPLSIGPILRCLSGAASGLGCAVPRLLASGLCSRKVTTVLTQDGVCQ